VYICSPSGKLVQIEYALAAVGAGSPSVGIKGDYLHALTLFKNRLTQHLIIFYVI